MNGQTLARSVTSALAVGALGLSGCGSDRAAGDHTAQATSMTAPVADAGSAPTATSAPATEVDDGCPEATSIHVTTAAGTTTTNALTSYIDILGDNESRPGPQSATLTFASYEIAVPDARGILMPTLTADQVMSTVSINNSTAAIAPGARYVDQVDQPDSPTQVTSFSLYTGAGRSLPTAHHTVTFTVVDDEKACGTVVPTRDRDGRVEVSFVARRIDA